MTVAAYPPVEQLLPYRSPMILIDRLVEANEQEGRCEVTLRLRSTSFKPKAVESYLEGVDHDHSCTHQRC